MYQRTQTFDPRQNMRVDSYELFRYRDARMGSVALHHHDFYEIYLFLGGRVEYRIEGRSYQLQPGDLLLISPLVLHQPIISPDSEPYERMVLWIDGNYLQGLSTERTDLTRCFQGANHSRANLLRLPPQDYARIGSQLENLARENANPSYGGDAAALGYLLQFLVEVNRLARRRETRYNGRETASPLINQALTYIDRYYLEDLSLEQLAGQLFVNQYHLAHEFRRVVGTGVHHYILLRRLATARQLMAEGVTPSQVAQRCGFRDYTNFYRAFKNEYGISPREYLEEHTKV